MHSAAAALRRTYARTQHVGHDGPWHLCMAHTCARRWIEGAERDGEDEDEDDGEIYMGFIEGFEIYVRRSCAATCACTCGRLLQGLQSATSCYIRRYACNCRALLCAP